MGPTSIASLVRISVIAASLVLPSFCKAATVAFFDDSSAYPEVYALATIGGGGTVDRKVDQVPASASSSQTDPIRGNSTASATLTREFLNGLAIGSIHAESNATLSASGNAYGLDEFKFTLDAATPLTVSASVQFASGNPGVQAAGVRFYLQTINGGQPLVLYSHIPGLGPPPTTEPRYTLNLQPGTYIFHVEAGHGAPGAQNGGNGLDYRLDFVPEPSVTILLAACLPLGLLRHPTRTGHRRTVGA